MDNTNIEHGNVFQNTFYDDWFSNAFYGYEGNDTFIASAEDGLIHEDSFDWFYGGLGTDRVNYFLSTMAVNVDLSNGISIRDPGGLSEDWDVLSSIEDIVGSEHDDTLAGDDENNVFLGMGGHDDIDLGGGNDDGDGGAGNDTIDGDGGHDTVSGGYGDDVLFGGTGNDSVLGGVGFDTAYGEDGDDTLEGGDDDDRLYGGDDDDLLLGGHDDDSLYGNNHDDTLDGGQGADKVYGGDGADSLMGGTGDDSAYAGNGKDTLDGGEGDDKLFGNDGNDVFKMTGGDDTAHGGNGDDAMLFDTGNDVHITFGNDDPAGGFAGYYDVETPGGSFDSGEFTSIESVRTGAGDDHVYGNRDDNWIATQDGRDQISGHDGDDIILAGAGNDTLIGGDGDDTLSGGEGNDRFHYDRDHNGTDLIIDFQGGEDYLTFSDDFLDDLGVAQEDWADGPGGNSSFADHFFVSGAAILGNSILWADTADGFKAVAEFEGISVGALNALLDSRVIFTKPAVVNPIHKDVPDELFPDDHPTAGGLPGNFKREDDDTPDPLPRWLADDAIVGPEPVRGMAAGDWMSEATRQPDATDLWPKAEEDHPVREASAAYGVFGDPNGSGDVGGTLFHEDMLF